MQDRTKEALMRKLIAGLFVSLDGFATDTNEEMRWMTDDFGEEPGYGGRETADVKPPLRGARTRLGFSRVLGRGGEGVGRRTRFVRGMDGPDCPSEQRGSVVFYGYGKWIS
jgi:hypothetical protein